MGTTRWRFINQRNQAQIVVHDLQSAQNLASIVKRDPSGSWILLQEGTALLSPQPSSDAMLPLSAPEDPAARADPAATPFPAEAAPIPGPVGLAFPEPPAAPPFAKGAKTVPPFNTERRAHRRFKRRFRVLLVWKGKTFRTYSDNVSLGGMRLEKGIPAGVIGNPCRIVISRMSRPENLEIQCELLKERGDPQRVRFIGISAATARILGDWLQSAEAGMTAA